MARDHSQRPLDRRQRKTRAALHAALQAVIATKPFDAITVEDIADGADVTRATFYAHYPDKHALFEEVCAETHEAMLEAVQDASPRGRTFSGAGVAAVLRHAKAHSHLYRTILSGASGSRPRRALSEVLEAQAADIFRRVLSNSGRTPRAPLPFSVGAFTAALMHTIEAMLDRTVKGTPEEIAALFMRSQFSGLQWSLGLEDGDMVFRDATGTA